jgi:hypothetical protein
MRYFNYSRNIFGKWSPFISAYMPESKQAEGRKNYYLFSEHIRIPDHWTIQNCEQNFPPVKEITEND